MLAGFSCMAAIGMSAIGSADQMRRFWSETLQSTAEWATAPWAEAKRSIVSEWLRTKAATEAPPTRLGALAQPQLAVAGIEHAATAPSASVHLVPAAALAQAEAELAALQARVQWFEARADATDRILQHLRTRLDHVAEATLQRVPIGWAMPTAEVALGRMPNNFSLPAILLPHPVPLTGGLSGRPPTLAPTPVDGFVPPEANVPPEVAIGRHRTAQVERAHVETVPSMHLAPGARLANEDGSSRACARAATELAVPVVLQFGRNQSDLDAAQADRVGRLAAFASQCPALRFNIKSFTDNRGSGAANLDMSRHRANRVLAALISESAAGTIMKPQVKVEVHGATAPIASNATENGRNQNRRVEITAQLLQ
jgi:outer membrane protein OmpA-like peptidoglycan-associated protein